MENIDLLKELIRFKFDHKDTSQDKCKRIINLSNRLHELILLDLEFINELKADYEQHFNTKL